MKRGKKQEILLVGYSVTHKCFLTYRDPYVFAMIYGKDFGPNDVQDFALNRKSKRAFIKAWNVLNRKGVFKK